MAEAPSVLAERSEAPPQEPQAVTTTNDLTASFTNHVAELTADTFVCTGTVTQFPPPTDAQAASLPFSVDYTVSGPPASAIAADPMQVPLPGTAGTTLEGELPVFPNGTLGLADPHLAPVTIGSGQAVPLDTFTAGTGPQFPWQGYAGSAEAGLGTLVHEPGSGLAVGVDAGGSFTVPADGGLVSSPGTIHTHALSAALGDFEPPAWDPDLVITHQHAEWKLGETERVAQGLSSLAQLAALDTEITNRAYQALVAAGLSDEEMQRDSHYHLANVNTVVVTAIAKPPPPQLTLLAWDSFGLHAEHPGITTEGLKGTCLDLIAGTVADYVCWVDFAEGTGAWAAGLGGGQPYFGSHHFDRNPPFTSAEAFMSGKAYVAGLKKRIKDRLKRAQEAFGKGKDQDGRKELEAAEQGLGQMLHARQDAYAHSNYVDLPEKLQSEYRDVIDCKQDSLSEGLKGALKLTGWDENAKDPGKPPGDDYGHDENAPGHNRDKHPEKYDKARKAAVEDTNRAVEQIKKELHDDLGEDKAKEIWDKFGKKRDRV